ncbi:MAG TPA: Isoquinoline 1-oxidoreductase subunit [Myxococcaceae bacterium]|nr:Isoquinoline 1-oxidoreductase subunit [Myxococcaceae bacterium]
MMRTLVTLVLVLAGCGGKSVPPSDPVGQKPDQATGVAAFATVRAVLQHPRCQNCHPAGDAPLQGDEGRVHAMNVLRGPTGHGMAGAECTTCHGPANPPSNYGRHVPPGVAKAWHMPKPEEKLVFVGLKPRELCEQVKDPARNGGMDMAALRVHLEDPLVTWGWNPGFGRAPVSTPYATFIAAWETWAAAGAPCPD